MALNHIDSKQIGRLLYGITVERDTAALPQTTAEALFTVSGGRVLLTSIVGEVTTVIQTQANNTKLTANPTTGTSVDICTVLNISADEVGALYSITGTFADALAGGAAGAVAAPAVPVVLPVGTLDLDCAASNTGAVKWVATYVPLDVGASLTAA